MDVTETDHEDRLLWWGRSVTKEEFRRHKKIEAMLWYAIILSCPLCCILTWAWAHA